MAKSVDPDQMLHSAPSVQGLHCLLRPQYLGLLWYLSFYGGKCHVQGKLKKSGFSNYPISCCSQLFMLSEGRGLSATQDLFLSLKTWLQMNNQFNPGPAFANSVGPNQLASSKANWSGSALFVIQYVNLCHQSRSSNLIGWKLEVDMAS